MKLYHYWYRWHMFLYRQTPFVRFSIIIAPTLLFLIIWFFAIYRPLINKKTTLEQDLHQSYQTIKSKPSHEQMLAALKTKSIHDEKGLSLDHQRMVRVFKNKHLNITHFTYHSEKNDRTQPIEIQLEANQKNLHAIIPACLEANLIPLKVDATYNISKQTWNVLVHATLARFDNL